MRNYETEREGQIEFYETILPRVSPSLSLDDILADDNDGVLNGNLLEFKLSVSDLNSVLFQCVKYLSARRMRGKPVPANILIVSLNAHVAYRYESKDYLAQIERVYYGGASKDNAGFVANSWAERIDYGSSDEARERLVALLRSDEYTRIHLDENCIVGWGEAYYKAVPNSRKEDFLGDETGKHKTIGEIRNPTVFARYIHPYTEPSNVRFQYLMDRLNDFLQKKDLGAFYTPEPYVRRAQELLRSAIDRVPRGNDYVIIDRCAGTGNLELGLSDEELSHCVLSTVEYYEYKVMLELLGSKVRHIIPPVEASDTFTAGLVRGADALSREYVENGIIRQYVDDPSCTIILYENPPYAETTSLEHQKRGAGKRSSGWKSSWVVDQMREAVRGTRNVSHTAVNDMGNAFIWSGFEYYLRQATDSYLVFSPIKYWKAQHLVDKRLLGAFAGDRHHFHALKHTCVCVALWANEADSSEEFECEGYDIDGARLVDVGPLPFRRIHASYSEAYFDKRPIPESERIGILCGLNGLEKVGASTRSNRPARSDSILGYLAVYGSGFDNPDAHSSLLVAGRYDGHGFYLRRDNFLEKLPMFAASRYISYDGRWTERGRIMKSADGATRYAADVASGKLDRYLLQVLLFTCVEYQNHMRSITGSDGHLYRNELTLDATNGPTAASEKMADLTPDGEEQALLDAWSLVLSWAKRTSGYDSSLTYGLYQIGEELNTSHKDAQTDETVYDYPELNGAIKALKALNKQYYLRRIVPTLFEYEFLK